MPGRHVVVTGMGIVSCLGNDLTTVSGALRDGRSGIRFMPEYKELGLRSQVAGAPTLDLEATIDRKQLRFMGDAAAYACVAMRDAIADAKLSAEEISNARTGLIAGSGGGSAANQIAVADLLRSKGAKRIGPYMASRTMCSTVSANLATVYGIHGISYSITAACATSAHCIGHAARLIRNGEQDLVFAGGGEELHWGAAAQFDAMGALSKRDNEHPEQASRPYDVNRDGFVIAGGGGMLVLEEQEHARQRGARIYAEVVGYGRNSDGADMVAPSGDGAARCMRTALEEAGVVPDYINTHGTATPVGDLAELKALQDTFAGRCPPLSSTKALTGHSLGAAGVHEAIYCLLMLRDGFMAGSAHIEQLDPEAEDLPILRQSRAAELHAVMSNSFGFG
ncbi:MAG: beta-ketoacyl synthase N-terminal-like domain-containing protein, partial [Gammaproteobacteria bacterium]